MPKSYQEIEAERAAQRRRWDEACAAAKDPVMPFGKHRGVALRDLDYSYLEWCIANIETDDPLYKDLKAEHDRRWAE